MFEFLRFEITYRWKRPATYAYFALLFVLGFAMPAINVDISGGNKNLMINAPFIVAMMVFVGSILAVFVASAIMGTPVLRDYEKRITSLIFSAPISQKGYLGGKFLGSLLFTAFAGFGLILGLMAGFAVAWPWFDHPERIAPTNVGMYLSYFMIFVLPNLFFSGCLFFAAGTLTKKSTVIYAQAILLLLFYMISGQLTGNLDNKTLVGLLDPFGLKAMFDQMGYWSVAEQNMNVIALKGTLLYNRLLWMGVGMLALAYTFFRFDFKFTGKASKKQKEATLEYAQNAPSISLSAIPAAQLKQGLQAEIAQTIGTAWLYFKWVWKQLPFISVVIAGLLMLIMLFVFAGNQNQVDNYATSSYVMSIISGVFMLPMGLLVIFYTAELFWKERELNMHLIQDAMPASAMVRLGGKMLALFGVVSAISAILFVFGLCVQLLKGYPYICWDVFLLEAVGFVFTGIFYTALGLFGASVSKNKYMGMGIVFLFFISQMFSAQLGLEHPMFKADFTGMGYYSEMNGYGTWIYPYLSHLAYHLSLGALLFLAAVFGLKRGETGLSFGQRLKNSPYKNAKTMLAAASFVFVAAAFHVFFNTNILNTYSTPDQKEAKRADYEKELSKYAALPQPNIVAVDFRMELYPEKESFEAKGEYILKNNRSVEVAEIYIQEPRTPGVNFQVSFPAGAEQIERSEKHKFSVYRLAKPLKPGEETKMLFVASHEPKGFGATTRNVTLQNGTFFNNEVFSPLIGYQKGREITEKELRAKHGLKPKPEITDDRDDPEALQTVGIASQAVILRSFRAVIGTEADQTAMVPGYLKKQWTENGRAYFEYEMDKPMIHFYSIVSARYTTIKDVWESDSFGKVNLELYYHKGHDFNVESMRKASKASMEYNSKNFSPFQFRQFRILEFPAGASAQSFANTVPFGENIGFLQEIEEGDLDLTFYVTAHEAAHQWWGHQLIPSAADGGGLLSESLSQYSALMVMKNNFPKETVGNFLRSELDKYLKGRKDETKYERSLARDRGAQYIYYQKGSLAMYRLQDLIGEDSTNKALRNFMDDWGNKPAPFPTTKNLMPYFMAATPDSLDVIVDELFNKITIYEITAKELSYKAAGSGKYALDMEITFDKMLSDSLGNETPMQAEEWADIGVYPKDDSKKLRYFQKHKLKSGSNRISLTLDFEPGKAGADPLNIFINRKNNVAMREAEKK